MFETMSLDPAKETPGRQVVRRIGQGLVEAMEMAMKVGDREAAQAVAAECVLAETKDHLNRNESTREAGSSGSSARRH